LKPEPGVVVVVTNIPPCQFCAPPVDGGPPEPGPYDFRTRWGPWANGCEAHWRLYRAEEELGVGKGQLWITEEEVTSDV
jgi:hypothetical protein